MLFQTKKSINSITGGILKFKGEGIVVQTLSVFCGAEGIGKEDGEGRREGGHL